MSYHPCVTGQQFIDRVREIGRSHGGTSCVLYIQHGCAAPGPDEIVVSFRDLPECLTSGADEPRPLRKPRTPGANAESGSKTIDLRDKKGLPAQVANFQEAGRP